MCNSADESLINKASGTCTGQLGFLLRADIDRDGCVTSTDVAAVRASLIQYRSGCTRSKGYWKNHPDQLPKDGLTIAGQTYSQNQLRQILTQPATGYGAVTLAQQIVAAKLNISAGASPIAVPLGTAEALIFNLATGLLPHLAMLRCQRAPLRLMRKNSMHTIRGSSDRRRAHLSDCGRKVAFIHVKAS